MHKLSLEKQMVIICLENFITLLTERLITTVIHVDAGSFGLEAVISHNFRHLTLLSYSLRSVHKCIVLVQAVG